MAHLSVRLVDGVAAGEEKHALELARRLGDDRLLEGALVSVAVRLLKGEDVLLVEGAEDGDEAVLVRAEALHRLLENLRLVVEAVREERHEELLERALGLLLDVGLEVTVAVLRVLGGDLFLNESLAKDALGVALASNLDEDGVGDLTDVALLERLGEGPENLLGGGVELGLREWTRRGWAGQCWRWRGVERLTKRRTTGASTPRVFHGTTSGKNCDTGNLGRVRARTLSSSSGEELQIPVRRGGSR